MPSTANGSMPSLTMLGNRRAEIDGLVEWKRNAEILPLASMPAVIVYSPAGR